MAPDIEGGEVNDPRDPGGHTNMGVTAETLAHARNFLPGLPATVDKLTHSDCVLIYQHLYWLPIRGDALPLGVALLLFDAAVNQGVNRAVRFLQRALNVRDDGVFGPVTLAAAQRQGVKLIPEIAARRMHHYMMLDHLDDTFGLGWSRRLIKIFAAALAAPEEA